MHRFKATLTSFLAVAALATACLATQAQAEEKSPLVVAHEMINAWNAADADAIADLFTEDGRFLSMTVPAMVREGRETIREQWGALLADVGEIELQLRHITAVGNSVMIERVDVFTYKGKAGRVPVACVMDIENGKVKEWREYYDHASLMSEMGVTGADHGGD